MDEGRGVYERRASDYHELQPLRIGTYRSYHRLALDLIPYDAQEPFTILDLRCATGTFLLAVLEASPQATAVALDGSKAMLDTARQKLAGSARTTFIKRDLNEGLPSGLPTFELVSAFLSIHHCVHERKRALLRGVHELLSVDGWFFLIDAMPVRFDDQLFADGSAKLTSRRRQRLEAAGIEPDRIPHYEEASQGLEDDHPERDRIASLEDHLRWLREAGFGPVDDVWHSWFEHFLVARPKAV